MAFQLHIRQNLESASDHFGPGQVRRFEAGVVRVGSGSDCECRLDDGVFAPCQVVLTRGVGKLARVTACPQDGATTYLNGQPLVNPTLLRSGDELRVGHWTLRFQRLHDRAGLSRTFALMPNLARAALALILVAEVSIVLWLPRRVARASAWELQVARHRSTDLLEALRRRNRDSRSATDFEHRLRVEIDEELQARSAYVTQYGHLLSLGRYQQLYEELRAFDRILTALGQGVLPPALPEVDLDGGVRALLGEVSRR